MGPEQKNGDLLKRLFQAALKGNQGAHETLSHMAHGGEDKKEVQKLVDRLDKILSQARNND